MAKKKEHKWVVGTWYINPMGYMINYQRGNHAYGIIGRDFEDEDGEEVVLENGWHTLRVTPKMLENNEFIEADETTIGETLFEEAKRRGFANGVTFKQIHKKSPITIDVSGGNFGYEIDEEELNTLYVGNVDNQYLVYDSGKWAEIVSAEKELPFKVGETYKDSADGDVYKIDKIHSNDSEVYFTDSSADVQRYAPIEVVARFISRGVWVKVEEETTPKTELTDEQFEFLSEINYSDFTGDGSGICDWIDDNDRATRKRKEKIALGLQKLGVLSADVQNVNGENKMWVDVTNGYQAKDDKAKVGYRFVNLSYNGKPIEDYYVDGKFIDHKGDKNEKPTFVPNAWYIGNKKGVVGGDGSEDDFLIRVTGKVTQVTRDDGYTYNRIEYTRLIYGTPQDNYEPERNIPQYVANSDYEKSMVLATADQIKGYLVSQAERRGFVQGKSVFITKVGDFIVPENKRGWHYLMTTDELNYDGDRYTVYSDNHWWFNPSKEQPNYYEGKTQTELQTLLKAYTILAEKGNTEAKQEIAIIQKLIK